MTTSAPSLSLRWLESFTIWINIKIELSKDIFQFFLKQTIMFILATIIILILFSENHLEYEVEGVLVLLRCRRPGVPPVSSVPPKHLDGQYKSSH